jgi:outer membrane immunogenic protein
MNKVLAAGIAFAAVVAAGSAAAADLPMKAAAPVPPPPSWSGCWLSGGVGYGMSNVDQAVESNPGLIVVTQTQNWGGRGWLGRFGVGCDYQLNSSIVLGVLGDYDAMDIHGVGAPGALIVAGDMKESSAWSAGGRLGYLPYPNLMTYLDGGFSQTRFNQVNMTGLILGTAVTAQIPANTYNGWFLGGGAEYKLPWLSGLFWRTEYRFSSYRAADLVVFTGGAPSTAAVHMQPNVQTVTTSLVWKFNWMN